MSYAMFAQNKLVLSGLVNRYQQQQTERSDEQFRLSTQTLTLQSRITNTQASQSSELADLYKELREASNSQARDAVDAKIKKAQSEFDEQLAKLQDEVTQVSVKDNAIELEVKRLDSKVSALQKQLEAVQDAEGKGIDATTPKFNGVG